MYYKRKKLKSLLFADFCHYHVSATSLHMHVHLYRLFESGIYVRLCTIALCRKGIELCTMYIGMYINTKSYGKVGFSYNNN